MTDIDDRLVKCFQAVFHREGLSDEAMKLAGRDTVQRWDSAGLLELILVIEEEFDLDIFGLDVEQSTLDSYASIKQFVENAVQPQ